MACRRRPTNHQRKKLTMDELFPQNYRTNDPPTSVLAGKRVIVKAGTHRALILATYVGKQDGLTDEEAGELSGLRAFRSCCYWKRCGELRSAGYLEDTHTTRISEAGEQQRVCVITPLGLYHHLLIQEQNKL